MSEPRPPSDVPDSARPDWDALARRMAGESDEPEARRVDAWLAAHPEDAALLEAVAAGTRRNAAAELARPLDVEGALARVHARMDAPAPRRGSRPAAPPAISRFRVRRGPRWIVGGLAAAAAAAIVVVGRGRAPAASEQAAGGVATLAPGAAREAAVGAGLDSLRLADGTRVVLAPGARLRAAADYGRGTRTVTLEGAAWFAVAHDARRPFAVHAGGAVVRDVGTRFTVRTADARGGGVTVAVTEGAIALRAAGAGRDTDVVLHAGDRGALLADGRTVAARGAVTAEDTAWLRGRLVFHDAPLDAVRAELRRWYGVDLVVEDSVLARRRFTGEVLAGEPVGRVLQRIALAVGGELSRRGDLYTLRRPREAGGGR